MSYRPTIKSNTSGTLTDLPLDAATLDGHSMEQTGISSNTTTIPTTAQVKSYVDAAASGGIQEITTQYIRITDLSTGIYKLTYNGTKYIYYNGTSGTDTYELDSLYGLEDLLYVTKGSIFWYWNLNYHHVAVTNFVTGTTDSSSGTVNIRNLATVVTGSTFNLKTARPGTYILNNTNGVTITIGTGTLDVTPTSCVIHVYQYMNGTAIMRAWSMVYKASQSDVTYLYSGYTNDSGLTSGYSKLDITASYLKSHAYRPIQVNGAQILANTSATALNLSNDGNVTFTQVSGGKVKADCSVTVPTKTSDLTNDSGFITGINSSDVTTALGYTPLDKDKITLSGTTLTINLD